MAEDKDAYAKSYETRSEQVAGVSMVKHEQGSKQDGPQPDTSKEFEQRSAEEERFTEFYQTYRNNVEMQLKLF